MKILLAHNFYQQGGGEDAVYRAECELLRHHGDDVECYERYNDEIGNGPVAGVTTAAAALWSRRSAGELQTLLVRNKPDVVHFHNVFPLISPSAYYACRARGVAVVQTLHNYRLVCPNALLARDGGVCEDCLGRKIAWPSLRHRCYRGSVAATAAVAAMTAFHRGIGTWSRGVDRFIALTDFARGKLIAGGLPDARISVKPNFLDTPPLPGTGDGAYALFVGRLSEEKGLRVLMRAWKDLDVPLKIAGGGPLEAELGSWAAARGRGSVEVLGRRSREEVWQLMRGARFLVFPSLWYEGFPMTLLEAMASALPVLASAIGSMKEIVLDSGAGLGCRPGDGADLAAKALRLWKDTELCSELGRHGRYRFESRYDAGSNYRMLIAIYEEALAARRMTPGRMPRA